MRFTAAVAVVLISGVIALAQHTKIKEPTARVRPTPSSGHGTIAPTPVKNSSADELNRLEQRTASTLLNRSAVHHPSSRVAAPPAIDTGKKTSTRVARSRPPASAPKLR